MATDIQWGSLPEWIQAGAIIVTIIGLVISRPKVKIVHFLEANDHKDIVVVLANIGRKVAVAKMRFVLDSSDKEGWHGFTHPMTNEWSAYFIIIPSGQRTYYITSLYSAHQENVGWMPIAKCEVSLKRKWRSDKIMKFDINVEEMKYHHWFEDKNEKVLTRILSQHNMFKNIDSAAKELGEYFASQNILKHKAYLLDSKCNFCGDPYNQHYQMFGGEASRIYICPKTSKRHTLNV